MSLCGCLVLGGGGSVVWGGEGGGEIWRLSRLLDGLVFIIRFIIPSRSWGGGGGSW